MTSRDCVSPGVRFMYGVTHVLAITMTSRDCVSPGVRFMYGVTHVLCVSLMCLSLCVVNATFSAAYLFVTLSATLPL